MKQYTLSSFNAIVTIDGETVTVTVNGKTVKPKKGNFELTCTETEGAFEGAEVGKVYAFAPQSLIDSAPETKTETTETTETAETTETETPVQTEAEIAKAANRAKLKELKATADSLQKAMSAGLAELTSGKLTSDAFAQKYALPFSAANTAYAEFKASISGSDNEPAKEKTPAEIASENAIAAHKEVIAKHEAELAAHNETLAKMVAAHNETEGFAKIGKKSRKSGSGSGGGGERKCDYKMAQSIRKEYAGMLKNGKTQAEAISAIVTSSGLDRVMILRIVTYRQHLLKVEDKAFLETLPFPTEFWNRFAGEKMPKGCNGANKWYSKK